MEKEKSIFESMEVPNKLTITHRLPELLQKDSTGIIYDPKGGCPICEAEESKE